MISIGNLTIHGLDSACPLMLTFWTRRWGYIVFQPPVPSVGRRCGHGLCFYLSPNATPWASTFLIGWPGTHMPKSERRMVAVRRALWGHGYAAIRLDPQILDAAVFAVESRDDIGRREFLSILDSRKDWIESADRAEG